MIFVLRSVSLLMCCLAGITLIHPRSGWGRLGLFVPKLFTGSMIFPIGLVGMLAALWGWWAFKDVLTLLFGFTATVIASRHILRLMIQGRRAALELTAFHPLQNPVQQKAMLAHPWVVYWKNPAEVRWEQDVVLRRNDQGEPLLADVWYPPGTVEPSGLGLIYLHGSGWHYADKDFGTRQFFGHLSRQGHLIVDLAYSLAPVADLLRMVAEVKQAIGWMKQEAAKLDIDPKRVVLLGGSAGGQLALLSAYTPNDPRFDPSDLGLDTSVCAVISYYGPPDLRAQFERFSELPGLTGRSRLERAFMTFLEGRFGFDVVPVHNLLPSLLGGTPAEVPDLYELGSPSAHLGPECPPTLLLQGEHDFSGMAPEVERLHRALKEAGCRSFLCSLPDTDHGFDLFRPKWSPAAQVATFVTERFLARF